MEEEKEEVLAGFDPLVVHRRDPKTGQIVAAEYFTTIAHKGTVFYEWPKSSRNLWWGNRKFAGRLNKDGEPEKGIPHVKFVPVLTEDEKVGMKNDALTKELIQVKKELTAIKIEQDINAKIAKGLGEAPKPLPVQKNIAGEGKAQVQVK